MSYHNMDHADWVQRQIVPGRRLEGKRRRDNRKGWSAAPDRLSEFQCKVFDILGMLYGGIYNAPISWNAVQWKGWGNGIAIPVRASSGMSTFDFMHLTRFVFLCHEARIRGSIEPHSFNMFLLSFGQRSHEGDWSTRHPNLDEAVADFREYLPSDHRIIYHD